MRLAQIHSVLKTEPLFCVPGYRETLLEILEQHAQLSAADYEMARTGKAKSGSELDLDQMEVVAMLHESIVCFDCSTDVSQRTMNKRRR